jgi:hypothetical protein
VFAARVLQVLHHYHLHDLKVLFVRDPVSDEPLFVSAGRIIAKTKPFASEKCLQIAKNKEFTRLEAWKFKESRPHSTDQTFTCAGASATWLLSLAPIQLLYHTIPKSYEQRLRRLDSLAKLSLASCVK